MNNLLNDVDVNHPFHKGRDNWGQYNLETVPSQGAHWRKFFLRDKSMILVDLDPYYGEDGEVVCHGTPEEVEKYIEDNSY